MRDELKHYGIKRKSGRYPWGSGENPYQRSQSFIGYIRELESKGLSEKEIADSMGLTIKQMRSRRTLAREEVRAADAAYAMRLKDKGYSTTAIGEKMGKNESTIRSLLDPARLERNKITNATADILKEAVKEKQLIDIGKGTELHLGLTRTKLDAAVEKLQMEGYTVHYLRVPQMATGHETSMKVLAPPDTKWTDVNSNKHNIQMVNDISSNDGGRTFKKARPIQSISSDRVYIRYAEEGGSDKDGLIELRRGVEDLDMGNSLYSQVRIGVDKKHYMKGMAVYSDDIPEGYDVIYNVTKSKGTPKEKVFKEQTNDSTNPFGATIKPNGQRGALNIVNEEGDWHEWSRNLSSQFLSKQKPSLIKQQLDLDYKGKLEEFEEIMSLTNPVIKQRLLYSFADDVDSDAVHLKAAALPRQNTHVILPLNGVKEKEVYAPNYRNGEQVVLIRHPHGGIFELPVLTVNNNNAEAKKTIGSTAIDAIGIHPKAAAQLSGADFDGDSVIVIPLRNKNITTSSPLKQLQNFDPHTMYKGFEGMKVISEKNKQKEMGLISNLITDMTIKGANENEIAAAVRHSMVVIDAEKHELNYKQSYIDNNIASLKEKYQGSKGGGASTLISKASGQHRVPERKEHFKIDPKTGEKLYFETGATYVDKKGKTIAKTTQTTPMYEEKDARKLSSGTVVENLYADYANNLKALGNQSRKEALSLPGLSRNPSASKVYEKEVISLTSKLAIAERNAPLERKAQLLANQMIFKLKQDNPALADDKDKMKKERGRAIVLARERVGASKQRIDITPKEWEAIQNGAVYTNTLNRILSNTDIDILRDYATPRNKPTMTDAKIARAKSMAKSGYTQAEIAQQLGVSTGTIANAISG